MLHFQLSPLIQEEATALRSSPNMLLNTINVALSSLWLIGIAMIRWSYCIKIILGGDDDYSAELQVSPGKLYSIALYIIRPISEYTQLTKLFTL